MRVISGDDQHHDQNHRSLSVFNLRTAEREERHATISDSSRNLLLGLGEQSVALSLDTLRPTLTLSLVLGTLSVHLLLENTLTLALSLGLLDLL